MNCLAGCFQMAGTVMTQRMASLSGSDGHWSFSSYGARSVTGALDEGRGSKTHGEDDAGTPVGEGERSGGDPTCTACCLKKPSAWANTSSACIFFPLTASSSVFRVRSCREEQ